MNLKVAKGDLVLGQATIFIDDVDGHRETKCNIVAVGPVAKKIIRSRVKRAVAKYGAQGLLMVAAWLASQHAGFNAHRHMPLVMGAITSSVATSFKGELGTATHNFTNSTGDTFKVALFTSSATLGATTTAYATTNEITGTGYTAGGTTVTSSTPVTSGTTAIFDFTDAQWTTATFTANGCLCYNSSKSNRAIFVIAFGSDQSVTAGTFTIQWPTPDASNAIIRLS